jgi:hypothetical protein
MNWTETGVIITTPHAGKSNEKSHKPLRFTEKSTHAHEWQENFEKTF